jgi:flagellar FliJ protein
MPRFVFKLDGVLRQRQHVEKQRQRELAALQAQMTRLEDDLRATEATSRQAAMDLRERHLVGRLDMSYLAAHRRYTLALQRQATQIVQRMALLRKQIVQAQAVLVDAARERKAMEKLRDRQRSRWQAEQDRREMRMLDEAGALISHGNLHDASFEASDAAAAQSVEGVP